MEVPRKHLSASKSDVVYQVIQSVSSVHHWKGVHNNWLWMSLGKKTQLFLWVDFVWFLFQVSLKAIRYEVSPDREYALFAFNVEPVSTQI